MPDNNVIMFDEAGVDFKKPSRNGMSAGSLANIGLTAGVTGFLMAEVMRKMDGLFGTTEKIPKGVVKEMMEGVVEGLMNMFENRLFDKDHEIKQLKDQVNELQLKLDIALAEVEKGKKKKK